MTDDFKHLEALLIDMKESLERDLADFRKEVNARFDGLETAIKRHDAGILEGRES